VYHTPSTGAIISSGVKQVHKTNSGFAIEKFDNLFGLLWTFLRGKPCKVSIAPFDVCLNAAGDKDDTVPVHILDGCMINMREVFAE